MRDWHPALGSSVFAACCSSRDFFDNITKDNRARQQN